MSRLGISAVKTFTSVSAGHRITNVRRYPLAASARLVSVGASWLSVRPARFRFPPRCAPVRRKVLCTRYALSVTDVCYGDMEPLHLTWYGVAYFVRRTPSLAVSVQKRAFVDRSSHDTPGREREGKDAEWRGRVPVSSGLEESRGHQTMGGGRKKYGGRKEGGEGWGAGKDGKATGEEGEVAAARHDRFLTQQIGYHPPYLPMRLLCEVL